VLGGAADLDARTGFRELEGMKGGDARRTQKALPSKCFNVRCHPPKRRILPPPARTLRLMMYVSVACMRETKLYQCLSSRPSFYDHEISDLHRIQSCLLLFCSLMRYQSNFPCFSQQLTSSLNHRSLSDCHHTINFPRIPSCPPTQNHNPRHPKTTSKTSP